MFRVLWTVQGQRQEGLRTAHYLSSKGPLACLLMLVERVETVLGTMLRQRRGRLAWHVLYTARARVSAHGWSKLHVYRIYVSSSASHAHPQPTGPHSPERK